MKRLMTFCAVVVLLTATVVNADTWTTLDFPGATSTKITDISGSNLVGTYRVSQSPFLKGFIYNGSTWTTLDMPFFYLDSGSEYYKSEIYVDGSNIAGVAYRTVGNFMYDGVNWTFPVPEGLIFDISGNKLLGSYWPDASSDRSHGFIYDGTILTTLDIPGMDSTKIIAMNGTTIMGRGNVNWSSGIFFYDGTTWTGWDDMPGIPGGQPTDIDGSNIIGNTVNTEGIYSGFLYNMVGQSYTVLDRPGASATYITRIDGDNVVGYFTDAAGTHGFVYTIPEPAMLLLLGLGAAILKPKRTLVRLSKDM